MQLPPGLVSPLADASFRERKRVTQANPAAALRCSEGLEASRMPRPLALAREDVRPLLAATRCAAASAARAQATNSAERRVDDPAHARTPDRFRHPLGLVERRYASASPKNDGLAHSEVQRVLRHHSMWAKAACGLPSVEWSDGILGERPELTVRPSDDDHIAVWLTKPELQAG